MKAGENINKMMNNRHYVDNKVKKKKSSFVLFVLFS